MQLAGLRSLVTMGFEQLISGLPLSSTSSTCPSSALKGSPASWSGKQSEIPSALAARINGALKRWVVMNPLAICVGQIKRVVPDVCFSHQGEQGAMGVLEEACGLRDSQLSLQYLTDNFDPNKGVMY